MFESILICIIAGTIAGLLKQSVKKERYRKKYRNHNAFFASQSSNYKKNFNKNSITRYNVKFNEKSDSITQYIENEYNKHYEQYQDKLPKQKSTDNFIEKGRKYEYQIAKFYEAKNYEVYANGIKNGKKDGGIDIIAWNHDEVILIQCKNHKNEIEQDLIRKFIGDCAIFENKNKDKIKNRVVKRDFVSNSGASYASKMFLNDNREIVNFLNIKANF